MNELLFICLLSTCSSPALKEQVGYKPYTRVIDENQVTCLADNIYFESVSETTKGKQAVAFVTLNRVKNSRFPKSICEVVYQRKDGKCQFTWTCDPVREIKDADKYREAQQIATSAILNHKYTKDITKGAVFFHKKTIKPNWTRKTKKTIIIGKHIFYKL